LLLAIYLKIVQYRRLQRPKAHSQVFRSVGVYWKVVPPENEGFC